MRIESHHEQPEDARLLEVLHRALQGDTTALPDISRADHASLRSAGEAIGRPLLVTRTAAVSVLRGLIDERFPPMAAQGWASLMRHGFVEGVRGPIRPIEIDFEEEWEDAISAAISRLDEIGDLVDGEITRAEALTLLQLLGEP